jgi:ankyrin repeat protein
MKHLLLTTIAAVVLVGCGKATSNISIHDAARDGNIDAVKQALAAGVDVNTKKRMGLAAKRLLGWGKSKISILCEFLSMN